MTEILYRKQKGSSGQPFESGPEPRNGMPEDPISSQTSDIKYDRIEYPEQTCADYGSRTASKRFGYSNSLVLTIFILLGSLLLLLKFSNIYDNRVQGQNVPSDSTTGTLADPQKPISPDTNEIIRARYKELLPEEQRAVLIYDKYNKSVVNIDTVVVRRMNYMFQEYKDEAEGRGSGIVLRKEGLILTNFHVVEGANTITVTLFNGESYPAKKIGEDPNTDIAILKIEAPANSLVPIEFADSSQLLVGQLVYAIGNPFGLERTMTRGIISALNRTIGSKKQYRIIRGMIQIDAAINPGNSGGPLFDSAGRLIGMNTAIHSQIGESSGVGFAIPANTLLRISSTLIETGRIVRGDIGIIQVTETEKGLVPVLIDNEGAADRAGLRGRKRVLFTFTQNGQRYQAEKTIRPKEGYDIIVGINGTGIKTAEEFITTIEEHKPGETVQLEILRDNKRISLPVVLDAPASEK